MMSGGLFAALWSVGEWLKPLLVVLLLLLLVGKILDVVLRSRWGKGKCGERIVAHRLRKGLPGDEYTIISDVYLPLDDGTTTQIDHIVVSRFGVFVVETKMYSGWIFASEGSKVWTQTIYRKKNTFQNPIRQNYLHVCTISDRLGIPKEYLRGVVAFTGECEFKTPMPEGVVYSRGLADYIRRFSQPILKEKEVADIVDAIIAWNGSVSSAQRRSHVTNLKKRHTKGAER